MQMLAIYVVLDTHLFADVYANSHSSLNSPACYSLGKEMSCIHLDQLGWQWKGNAVVILAKRTSYTGSSRRLAASTLNTRCAFLVSTVSRLYLQDPCSE